MAKYLNTKSGSIEDVVKQMQNKVLESDYQDKFKKELEKAGKPLGQMTGAEKKAFFNKIDKMHTAKNEQAKNPYAIGMAAAMKAKDDKPPLKKSTITKAHDIAKSIEKDMKKEEVELIESHFKVGQKVKCKASGMTGTVSKVDPEEKGKYYTVKRSDGKEMKYSPDELTVVQTEAVEDQKKKEESNKEDQVDSLKNQVAMLKTKLENEKNKAIKPEPNPETGEVPLTVGIAYKHLRDKMKKESVEKDEKKDEVKAKGKTMTGKNTTPVEMQPSVDYKF